MKLVVINLDRSTQRMQHMQNQLDKLNLSFERFSAVDGKTLSNEDLSLFASEICTKAICNRGMIGCALSHMRVLQNFVASSDDYLCVLEDDCNLSEKFPQFLADIDSIYKTIDFDFISLYCLGLCSSLQKDTQVGDYTFSRPSFPLTTVCYIVSKKGANKLLNLIGEKVYYHIDFHIALKKLGKDFHYYVLKTPSLVFNNNETSTMGSNNSSMVLNILEAMNCKTVAWTLNVPVFSLFNMKYSVSLYLLLLLILLCFSFYYHIYVLSIFCLIEIILLIISTK